MRFLPALMIAAIACGAAIPSGFAADLPERQQAEVAPVAPPPPTILKPRFLSEVRFGLSAQDPWSPEAGSVNITGEVLTGKLFQADNATLDLFVPRFHVGGSANTAGATSFAYAGFTWTVPITAQLFVEASFGGAVHNGKTGDDVGPNRAALGCSPLFRESASVGWRFDEHWSLLATIEHLSNGGLCEQNRGLTNVGARVAYSF
ncbi:acyloxyacyl hydrolase [Chelatococcus asaccharovorans]|uniref:acyloxyacyl hydrolase n=1 Tax=Chelatococcus asaccharovorans TaxID=28210 RepID=UPI00224C6B37|nr:acyloxyacyl hydrolase [Chelatococcus asaccharovorans]CAH1648444.1 Lipid A 3-O-deacylase PagL [Chelatococcus asaccharovorans]CAH1687773.1 Lipid A 3-O-deacylase PagL [Chelatococcus asaccharovorans]